MMDLDQKYAPLLAMSLDQCCRMWWKGVSCKGRRVLGSESAMVLTDVCGSDTWFAH